MSLEVRLEKHATRYICGFRKARKFERFERFLRERAAGILAYTELCVCPFCRRSFKGPLGLRNHLKGYGECGRRFRELVDQLVSEYSKSKKR